MTAGAGGGTAAGRDDRPVLVTGGAGFIGSHVVETLARAGEPVRVLDDFSTGREENLLPALATGRVEVARGDILDPAARAAALRGARALVHLAALTSVPASIADPGRCDLVNRVASQALLEEALTAGVEGAVFASSCAVYTSSATATATATAPEETDRGPVPAREADADTPAHAEAEADADADSGWKVGAGPGDLRSPYAASKLAVERWIARRAAGGGPPPVVSLRFFNVYGPRQDPNGPYAAVVPAFLAAALAGRPATIFGDGRQTRDFVFVEDVVDAIRAGIHGAGSDRARGGVFNVGSGRATTLLDLQATIRRLVPGAPPARHRPARVGDILHSRAGTARAREILGFEARTGLEDGLARTLRAMRS